VVGVRYSKLSNFKASHRMGDQYSPFCSNELTNKAWEREVSIGHCQCQKEFDDHLLACQLLKESHIVTRQANVRASFLEINDINDML
jgi:hypothetical protein